jgi:hypothetical protein
VRHDLGLDGLGFHRRDLSLCHFSVLPVAEPHRQPRAVLLCLRRNRLRRRRSRQRKLQEGSIGGTAASSSTKIRKSLHGSFRVCQSERTKEERRSGEVRSGQVKAQETLASNDGMSRWTRVFEILFEVVRLERKGRRARTMCVVVAWLCSHVKSE